MTTTAFIVQRQTPDGWEEIARLHRARDAKHFVEGHREAAPQTKIRILRELTFGDSLYVEGIDEAKP